LIFIALFVIVALISKLIGGYFGAKFSGFSNHSSMMIGAGMVSRGEMALVILQLGVAGKLLTNEYYSALVIVILLTTLISPLVLKFFTKKVSQAAAEQTAEQMVPFTVEENHQTI
jgi:Kef-type K+ transport system membrane component KefB